MSTANINPASTGDILIVDDTQSDLKLLTDILRKAGYTVRPASDGELALRSVRARLPELILLDIQMPGLDGYEVCRRLKDSEDTRNIPVIFISVKTSTIDKVKAFGLGGSDYINKPFESEEVLARVATHLALRKAQKKVHEKNLQLQHEIADRVQAEEVLRKSEKFLQDVFNAIGDGISVLDRNLKIIRVNSWMEKMYSREGGLAGNMCYEVYQNRDTPCPWCPSLKTIETGEPHSATVPYPSEENPIGWIDLSSFPLSNAEGDLIGVIEYVKNITQLMKMQSALKEANDIIDRSQVVAFLWKNEEGWPVEFVSDNVKELFGYTAEEFTSGTVGYTGIVHPDDIERVAEEVSNYSKDNERTDFVHEPYRIITKNGKTIWLDDRTHIRRDNKGEITHYEGVVIDITERKRAEKALRLERDNLHNIFNSIEDGIYIVNQQYDIQYVNPVLVKDFGPYEGRKCYKYFHDLDEVCPWCKNQDVWAGKTVRWEWYSSKNERTYDLIDTPMTLPDGSIGKLEIFRDITERKQAEAAVRESEEKYRSMMNAMKDPVYICSPDYRVEYMNPAMIRSLGRDATGEKCFKAIYDLDEICTWCMHSKISRKECFEYNIVSPRNNRHYQVTNSPIVHEDGSKSKMTVFRDTTDFIKMEEQLRQAQKMEAIGALAGGVAHDFNNLLTVIIGNAHIALMEVGKDGPLREEIETIREAGERAAVLTRQLLVFSRKQIIQPKILDLNELLTDIDKMLGRLIGEDVELLTIPEPALWQVEVDPGQMEQVIMNLVVNAKDAMPKGGKLTVETANVDLDENYFHEHGIKEEQPGSYVMLAVSDTGSGMDKETQEHIFEPFYTTKEMGKGTGLGLSTVYGIVKQNKGFIWVYSEPGQGTTFKVYLSKVKGDVEEEEKERTHVVELGGSETVLIVEDDDSLRKLARTVLKQNGYKVLEAENGEDALRVSETHDGSIELMITDVVMPKMSGKETAERLQLLYPQMKVIYMSGYTDDAIVHHGVLAPGLNFLEKPFTPENLARKVREVLDA